MNDVIKRWTFEFAHPAAPNKWDASAQVFGDLVNASQAAQKWMLLNAQNNWYILVRIAPLPGDRPGIPSYPPNNIASES